MIKVREPNLLSCLQSYKSTSTPIVILGRSDSLLIFLTFVPVTSSHSWNLLPWPYLKYHHPEFLFLKSYILITDNSHLPSFFTSSFLLNFSPLFCSLSLLHSHLLLTVTFSPKLSAPLRCSLFLI